MQLIDISQATTLQHSIDVARLLVVYLFIFGLYRLSAPTTSAYGIRIAGYALLLAALTVGIYCIGVDATLSALRTNLELAAAAAGLGGIVAWWRTKSAAEEIQPQLTALFSALGAAAAVTVAHFQLYANQTHSLRTTIPALIAGLLASISCVGSLVAWSKLSGAVNYSLRLSGRPAMMTFLLIAAIALAVCITGAAQGTVAPFMPLAGLLGLFVLCGMLLGTLVSLPNTCGDLPIVVTMNNAMTGVAVAIIGYLLQIPLLTIAGALAAGAGLILTQLRARAANRFVGSELVYGESDERRRVRSLDPGDAAIFMRYARKIVIVPGYGLAVAQGQQTLVEFIKLLEAAGVEIKVALHAMAGRMPDQMAVILTEAQLPDAMVLEPSETDEAFRSADVALVIGANDVVNSLASNSRSLPLFGIPTLNVAMAQKLYVIKRGAGLGFAGIENPSFDSEHCHIVYGDAQSMLSKMVEAIRAADIRVAA